MNTYPKLEEPFVFWLVRQYLPVVENKEEDVQPINREFYSIMGMIVLAVAVLDIIFHGLLL